MSQPISSASNWNNEYRRGGIPSSVRDAPSGAVRTFVNFLKARGMTSGCAVDIGCGTGRNSIYLQSIGYKVLAMDFASDVIVRLNDQIKSDAELKTSIITVCQDVAEKWPAEDASFDIAVDTFCFKHQIRPENIEAYKRELKRTLKIGGYFLLTLAGIDDGYYASLLTRSPDRRRNVIVDPENGISSILYSKDKIIELFDKDYVLCEYEHKTNPSEMHGKIYP